MQRTARKQKQQHTRRVNETLNQRRVERVVDPITDPKFDLMAWANQQRGVTA